MYITKRYRVYSSYLRSKKALDCFKLQEIMILTIFKEILQKIYISEINLIFNSIYVTFILVQIKFSYCKIILKVNKFHMRAKKKKKNVS